MKMLIVTVIDPVKAISLYAGQDNNSLIPIN
jgi:hypothetical protein